MLTCPWCGETEPNEMLLRNNHWVRSGEESGYDWCADHGMCIAMSLTRAHVENYARRLRGGWPDREGGRKALASAIARAEAVWAKAGTGWLDDYRPLAHAPRPPEHAVVGASEQGGLFR